MPENLGNQSVCEIWPSWILFFLLVPWIITAQIDGQTQEFGDPAMNEVGYAPWECSSGWPPETEFNRGMTFTFSYDLRIVPSLFEPTHFAAQLYVNGEQYGDPVEFYTLPGAEIATESPSWTKIKAKGPRDMTVQVRMSAITWMSTNKLEYPSTVAHYRVVCDNWLFRLFRRCWAPSKFGHVYSPPYCSKSLETF